MKNLKSIINTNLWRLAAAMVALILLVGVVLQVMMAQKQAREHAAGTFVQVGQILHENAAELGSVEEDYEETCLLNAETIAYIIGYHPEILGNVEEFRQLAYMMQVDEIHIFDQTGRIFTGTHPEYFNFTFDSGVQMNFFKPMMEDKSLRLCQEITPNTAEGKLVQYSALWSQDGQFIVQVGMYPEAVLESTEKNELSYIFSLLQGSPGVSLYAIDGATGRIVGSTSGTDNGKSMSQVGFAAYDVEDYKTGAHVTLNGVDSYCIFEEINDTYIGYVISHDELYSNIFSYTLILAICLLLIAVVFVLGVQGFINRYIIGSIASINEKLGAVAAGDLDERMGEDSSIEFAELSTYINHMIQSLLATTDKMGEVLNRTNLRIGVYEYNGQMKTVRFTDRVPQILGLSPQEAEELTGDVQKLNEFIQRLRQEPVPGVENTYRFVGQEEMYLKLEEIQRGSNVMGILMDVTEATRHLKQAETERDIDQLTGIYNRRGMERQLALRFREPESLGCGALMMVDSDNMKVVNDSYGHSVGDAHLKMLAYLLENVGSAQSLAGRIGGDEFLLLLYGYPDNVALHEDLARIRRLQESAVLPLEEGQEIPLDFSFGYVPIQGRRDYDAMIMEADEYMYRSKRLRKQVRARQEAPVP